MKNRYDLGVRGASIEIGDRVLIRNVGLKGKQKLADRWGPDIYIVKRQPNREIPVYSLSKEDGSGGEKILHRNMLLPLAIPLREETSDVSHSVLERKAKPQKELLSQKKSEEATDSSSEEEMEQVVYRWKSRRIVPVNLPYSGNRSRVNEEREACQEGSKSPNIMGVEGLPEGQHESGSHEVEQNAVNKVQEEYATGTVSVDPGPSQSDVDVTVGNPGGDIASAVRNNEPIENGLSWSIAESETNKSQHDASESAGEQVPVVRRSNRVRRPPDRYGDWVSCPVQVSSVWKDKCDYLVELRQHFPDKKDAIFTQIMKLMEEL
jgi:hypothetical protein